MAKHSDDPAYDQPCQHDFQHSDSFTKTMNMSEWEEWGTFYCRKCLTRKHVKLRSMVNDKITHHSGDTVVDTLSYYKR